jgi:predicted nucleic acid-binding protein
MLERFVDTSGWAAWADRREQFHHLAVITIEEVWRQNGRLVTTNWVLAELTALLTSPLRVTKPQQIQLLQDIRADPGVVLVTIDPALEAAGWHLWEARPDKEWTVIDCVSLVVMQQRHISEAVTADHHFEQAGFVRLLK